MFAKQKYESNNPFNQEGNYLLDLLKNNSNVGVKKKPTNSNLNVKSFDFKRNNKTICIKLS